MNDKIGNCALHDTVDWCYQCGFYSQNAKHFHGNIHIRKVWPFLCRYPWNSQILNSAMCRPPIPFLYWYQLDTQFFI